MLKSNWQCPENEPWCQLGFLRHMVVARWQILRSLYILTYMGTWVKKGKKLFRIVSTHFINIFMGSMWSSNHFSTLDVSVRKLPWLNNLWETLPSELTYCSGYLAETLRCVPVQCYPGWCLLAVELLRGCIWRSVTWMSAGDFPAQSIAGVGFSAAEYSGDSCPACLLSVNCATPTPAGWDTVCSPLLGLLRHGTLINSTF